MRKFIILILFSTFYFSAAFAEIVKDIKIQGNKRVSDATIKIYGDIKINENYSEIDLNNILNNLYLTNFFEDVNIELKNGVLSINLVEYPIIDTIIILGEPSKKYKEEIKKLITSKDKGSYIKKNIANDSNIIKKLYSSIGYNFAKVNTKVKKISENRLDVVFEVDKGNVTEISKISFTGDKKIKEKRLRDIIASEESKFWKFISRNTRFSQNLVNLDMRLLENYYRSNGYYDVKIKSNSAEIKKSGNVELVYTIDAGKRYIFKKISTNVDPTFDKNLFFELNKDYQKIIGDYYSPFKIKKLLESIDEVIEKNNLQFVEHNVEEIVDGDGIEVKFNIYEGNKVLVERINILGNNITNEEVIRGELLVDEGDPFTNLNLDKSIAKIKAKNIFRTVKSKVVEGSTSDMKLIDIEVEEKPTGEISAGAGVGTNGGSLAFQVKENNWLGEGKNVSFDIELDEESVRGTLDYVDPNYNFLGNSLGYSVSSVTNDKPDQGYENTLISAGVRTGFEQFKDLYAQLGLTASYDDLKTLDSASASLKKQSGNFSELAANYGFTYDKRNRVFMPTDGRIISFEQTAPLYADKSFIANTFSTSFYKSLSEDVIGAAKFYISAVNGLGSDDVRLSKRKALSSKRLRGFEKGKVGPIDGADHIGGNYSAAINFEASLPKILPESTNTDINLFLDFGNVWGVDYDSSIDESNKIRSSTGIAASWLSPLGPMTFIFSTNISKASTDVTEGFNFNLGTTF